MTEVKHRQKTLEDRVKRLRSWHIASSDDARIQIELDMNYFVYDILNETDLCGYSNQHVASQIRLIYKILEYILDTLDATR